MLLKWIKWVKKIKLTNLVEVNNKQAVTTSIMVAETFGKRHDHVLRDIRNLIKKSQSVEPMFTEGESEDSYGRKRKTIYMNRDGFTLLIMGFNGKEVTKLSWSISTLSMKWRSVSKLLR